METHICSKKLESSNNQSCYSPVPETVEIEFEDDDEEPDTCSKYVIQVQEKVSEYWTKYCRYIKHLIVFMCILGYSVYFVAALMHKFGDEGMCSLVKIFVKTFGIFFKLKDSFLIVTLCSLQVRTD